MKNLTRTAGALVLASAAATPAFAQEATPVATALAGADILEYASSAQGLVVIGLIMLVAFRFLKRAF